VPDGGFGEELDRIWRAGSTVGGGGLGERALDGDGRRQWILQPDTD
jgi:hypothetical protein